MERAVCEKCGEPQPVDWAAGDLCVACGSAVRREVRCAWCAAWIPTGRFCRSCGCEVVNERLYGAARMLKIAGVDRFSIYTRLRELAPDLVENLSRIYDRQLAVVLLRCEEARLCEAHLLQKTHARRLEDKLVPLLPMENDELEALASGPAGPFERRPELLPEIARASPVAETRLLAAVALLRRGCAEQDYLTGARTALESKDQDLAVEAALGLAHWSLRLYPRPLFHESYAGGAGIDRRRLADVAGKVTPASRLLPWAAAAIALALFPDGVLPAAGIASAEEPDAVESLRAPLRDGLNSGDPDLRFTCALALGEERLVEAELDAANGKRRAVARRFLAGLNSTSVGRCLAGGPDEIRDEVLSGLRPPLPEGLIEPVLRLVEHGEPEFRQRGAQLLLPALTSSIVSRLVEVAARERDLDLFRTLLRAEPLPESRAVVASVIECGLLQDLYHELAYRVDYSHESVIRLAAEGDPQTLDTLILMAGWQLDRSDSLGQFVPEALAAGRFLAGTAFGARPAEIRIRAYGRLAGSHAGMWHWMCARSLEALFGSPGSFLAAVTGALTDPELRTQEIRSRIVQELSEYWPELGPLFTECPQAVAGLAAALAELLAMDFWDDRSWPESLVRDMAQLYPAEALPAIVGLLSDPGSLSHPWYVFPRLRDSYGRWGPGLKDDPGRLSKVAGLCLQILTTSVGEDGNVGSAAAEVMEQIARDYPGCRQEIASQLSPVVAGPESVGEVARGLLLRVAEAVGLQAQPPKNDDAVLEDATLSNREFFQETLERLDNEVLLPGDPLPTLAKYCRFMRAMGKAVSPMDAMAAFGMTADGCSRSVSRWGELLSRRDDVATRYAQLISMQDQSDPAPPKSRA